MYITTSTAPDLPFLQWLVESWKTFTTSASLSNVRNLENTLLNQFLTSTMLKNAATNSLGLSPSDPIIVSLLSLTWSDAEDDAAVRTAARAFMQSVETEAKKRRVHRAYLYLNYADGGQNVMDGYGKSSKEKLRRISKRYDPRGVFQKAVPGGFKLWP